MPTKPGESYPLDRNDPDGWIITRDEPEPDPDTAAGNLLQNLPTGVSPGPVVEGSRTWAARYAELDSTSPFYDGVCLGLWATPEDAVSAREEFARSRTIPEGVIPCPRGLMNPNFDEREQT